MNNCVFVGNLTHDPELRTLPSGTKVVKVGLAVNVQRREDLEPETSFITLEAWSSAAEAIGQTFKKGDRMFVICNARNDKWTDANGNKRSKIIFRINSFGKAHMGRKVEQGENKEEATTTF